VLGGQRVYVLISPVVRFLSAVPTTKHFLGAFDWRFRDWLFIPWQSCVAVWAHDSFIARVQCALTHYPDNAVRARWVQSILAHDQL